MLRFLLVMNHITQALQRCALQTKSHSMPQILTKTESFQTSSDLCDISSILKRYKRQRRRASILAGTRSRTGKLFRSLCSNLLLTASLAQRSRIRCLSTICHGCQPVDRSIRPIEVLFILRPSLGSAQRRLDEGHPSAR